MFDCSFNGPIRKMSGLFTNYRICRFWFYAFKHRDNFTFYYRDNYSYTTGSRMATAELHVRCIPSRNQRSSQNGTSNTIRTALFVNNDFFCSSFVPHSMPVFFYVGLLPSDFVFSYRPDRLQGLPGLVSNGYRSFSARIKTTGAWSGRLNFL
jgi:hypothetical protein